MAAKTVKPKPPYPTDVSDEEWQFCRPYLELMNEDAPQREHPLRDLFNAVRYVARAGCPWRMLPHDLPPWAAVYQQWQRWIKAGCMEAMTHDLRMLLRMLSQKEAQPSAVILDGRTMQSTPESGARAGYDGVLIRGRRYAISWNTSFVVVNRQKPVLRTQAIPPLSTAHY